MSSYEHPLDFLERLEGKEPKVYGSFVERVPDAIPFIRNAAEVLGKMYDDEFLKTDLMKVAKRNQANKNAGARRLDARIDLLFDGEHGIREFLESTNINWAAWSLRDIIRTLNADDELHTFLRTKTAARFGFQAFASAAPFGAFVEYIDHASVSWGELAEKNDKDTEDGKPEPEEVKIPKWVSTSIKKNEKHNEVENLLRNKLGTVNHRVSFVERNAPRGMTDTDRIRYAGIRQSQYTRAREVLGLPMRKPPQKRTLGRM